MNEEIAIERVKQALKRATDNVKALPISFPRKARAVNALIGVRMRLGSVTRNPEDLNTSALLLHFPEKKRDEIKAVLDANPSLRLLYHFGSVPEWVFIEAVFVAANVECPLELRSFYTAYQEEVKTLS